MSGIIHSLKRKYTYFIFGICHVFVTQPPPPPPRLMSDTCQSFNNLKGQKSCFWHCHNLCAYLELAWPMSSLSAPLPSITHETKQIYWLPSFVYGRYKRYTIHTVSPNACLKISNSTQCVSIESLKWNCIHLIYYIGRIVVCTPYSMCYNCSMSFYGLKPLKLIAQTKTKWSVLFY